MPGNGAGSDSAPNPSKDRPGVFVILDEGPFDRCWLGLSWDWAETLPCLARRVAWDLIWDRYRGDVRLALASPHSPAFDRRWFLFADWGPGVTPWG